MKEVPLKTILIVENENELREFLAVHFSDLYHVLEAKDGVEAEELLEKQIVHVVLSEVTMPRKNGIELCRDLKSNIETSHIPVVLLTAKSTFDDRMTGLEGGADAYVEKPFSLVFVRKLIENLLENRRRILEKFAHEPFVHSEALELNKTDKSFIQKVTSFILENLDNQNLDVDILAEKMFMSRSTLYRKIKAVTGEAPSDFIRLVRLKRAAELLASGTYRAMEVSEMVGYSSFSWFYKAFQKQFGTHPTEYVQSFRSQEENS